MQGRFGGSRASDLRHEVCGRLLTSPSGVRTKRLTAKTKPATRAHLCVRELTQQGTHNSRGHAPKIIAQSIGLLSMFRIQEGFVHYYYLARQALDKAG